MASIKISNLEQINIYNPESSFIMVVAQTEEGAPFRNYRISLEELRRIIGSIEGDIVTGVTEEQVRSIVNAAILEDNDNELNQLSVQKMIDDSIANIDMPAAGLSESEVNILIQNAITSDNRNELTQSQVVQLIKQYTPSQHITETRVTELINSAITEDNKSDLQESRVQDMIDSAIQSIPTVEPGISSDEVQQMINDSINADNLKEHIETVIPDVVPDIIPKTEINVPVGEETKTITVTDVATKVLVQENTVIEVQSNLSEITKTITEDCVCDTHADECFNNIFK